MKALIVAETSMASSGNLIQEAKIISKSFRWLSFTHSKHVFKPQFHISPNLFSNTEMNVRLT